MRQIINRFLCVIILACGVQASWSFSFLGPLGNGGDSWQTGQDGFNPLNSPPLNPYGFVDGLLVGPKNIGEGYRYNTPVLYYTFDDNFTGFFGSNGTNAVIGAFAILNNLTNVDSYSSGLTEFPLDSIGLNYQAQALDLYDLRSLSLTLLMEELGVADSVRYTWVLHSRWHTGTPACPAGMNYLVTERNFDINPTPLTQLQYSPYVNGELYTYSIYEDCGAAGSPTPIDGASIPIPADPLNDSPPVASGHGMGFLSAGGYYTGLTRDDVAALRYLLRAANINTESPAAGSLLQSTSVGTPSQLTTLDLNLLLSAAVTNSPAALVGLFPGLVVASSTSYYTNINTPNIVTYTTNFAGEPIGTPPHVVTVTNGFISSFVLNYITTFANVVTNSFRSNSVAKLVTTTVGIPTGAPVGSPFVTTTTTKTITLTNDPSGDYYLIPAGSCGWDLTPQSLTNVVATTNVIVTSVNASGASVTQSLITYFTNHVYIAQQVFCPLVTPPAGKYEGIENIKFVGIDASQYDSLTGQFITPITNNYTMSFYSNGVVIIQNFQRVVTSPDFLFTASDLTTIGGVHNVLDRTTPNFNQANILNGLAGPGTIDPGAVITYNKSGPVFGNTTPSFLNGPNYGSEFNYGSFDGTTNAPVIYPNGTSLAELEAEVFIQISPSTLPAATSGYPYSATFSATGGQTPYTWSLATNSPALPNGLTLSSSGVISGTPTQSGVYDFVIQLNDSASHILQANYLITIN